MKFFKWGKDQQDEVFDSGGQVKTEAGENITIPKGFDVNSLVRSGDDLELLLPNGVEKVTYENFFSQGNNLSINGRELSPTELGGILSQNIEIINPSGEVILSFYAMPGASLPLNIPLDFDVHASNADAKHIDDSIVITLNNGRVIILYSTPGEKDLSGELVAYEPEMINTDTQYDEEELAPLCPISVNGVVMPKFTNDISHSLEQQLALSKEYNIPVSTIPPKGDLPIMLNSNEAGFKFLDGNFGAIGAGFATVATIGIVTAAARTEFITMEDSSAEEAEEPIDYQVQSTNTLPLLPPEPLPPPIDQGFQAVPDIFLTNAISIGATAPINGLLFNDINPSNSTLTIISVDNPTNGGTVSLIPDFVEFIYPTLLMPPSSFDYTVSDGTNISTTNVNIIFIDEGTINGSDASEVIFGPGILNGNGGNDFIQAANFESAFLDGGPGDDTLVPKAGVFGDIDGGPDTDTVQFFEGDNLSTSDNTFTGIEIFDLLTDDNPNTLTISATDVATVPDPGINVINISGAANDTLELTGGWTETAAGSNVYGNTDNVIQVAVDAAVTVIT